MAEGKLCSVDIRLAFHSLIQCPGGNLFMGGQGAGEEPVPPSTEKGILRFSDFRFPIDLNRIRN